MKKVGILYICTGKYDVFWEEFYESCEKNFLENVEKHYFVFTDSNKLFAENINSNIHKYYQQNLGWPDNTLKRFHFMLKAKEDLLKMDYIYFFNANSLIIKKIPNCDFIINENYLFINHFGYPPKKNHKFPYDRNRKSTAYIPKGKGDIYIMGGVNGGKSKCFVELMEQLKKNIDIDINNSQIAKWHDESHLNKILLSIDNYKILPYLYTSPEEWPNSKNAFIIFRDKKKYFNVNDFKKVNLWKKIKTFINLKIIRKFFVK